VSRDARDRVGACQIGEASHHRGMMSVKITAGAGLHLQKLGHADQAAVRLDEGIPMFDESFPRDRTNYLTHLADALVQSGKQRNFDAAAARGMGHD